MQWLLVTSGQGPAECERFVQELVKMITNDAMSNAVDLELLRAVPGGYDGLLASALLSVAGDDAPTLVTRWEGTHKWICESPYRPNHKRKNWFVGVRSFAAPSRPQWSEADLKIEAFRSSGPGGQHANKTSSAVRVTHLPSGMSVVAQEERSQARNRGLALARLDQLFQRRDQAQRDSAERDVWLEHARLERGAEIAVFEGSRFRRVK